MKEAGKCRLLSFWRRINYGDTQAVGIEPTLAPAAEYFLLARPHPFHICAPPS